MARSRPGVEGNLWDAVNYFIEGARDSVIDFGLHCSLVAGDMAGAREARPAHLRARRPVVQGFHGVPEARGMFPVGRRCCASAAPLTAAGSSVTPRTATSATTSRTGSRRKAEPLSGDGPSRPGITEAEATFRILSFAERPDCPMYVVHVSTKMAMGILAIRLYRQWNKAHYARPARTTVR